MKKLQHAEHSPQKTSNKQSSSAAAVTPGRLQKYSEEATFSKKKK
jgi:hypothetical protein